MRPQSVNERLVPEVRAPEICEAPWAQVILRRWRSKYRREMHNENLGNVTGGLRHSMSRDEQSRCSRLQ